MKALKFLVETFCAILTAVSLSYCDNLELTNGTVMLDCYVRDEATRFIVWESMDKVGTPDFKVIPRNLVSQREGSWKVQRVPEWDAHPQLPDLSITYIEMNPKLAGLHGKVQYDNYGRPFPGGTPTLDKRAAELGEERRYLEPEYVVQDLKLSYKPGEIVTLTAHIQNTGFADSQPFEYRWLIDDKEVAKNKYDKTIKELAEATFEYKYPWQEGKHNMTFEIITNQKEIAVINNKVTEALYAYNYFFLVNPKMCEAWHRYRSGYGTFSWYDYYRWHLDIMNILFEASVFPSAPNGIVARVRLGNVLLVDDVKEDTIKKALIKYKEHDQEGIGYHQGGWSWGQSEEENKGNWNARSYSQIGTEWSLPHELGHQLGLPDSYFLDYGGHEYHKWQDNGDLITHFQNHPGNMMHWHGPAIFNESDANYLNTSWDKPRGHFGDGYFAIPDENFLSIVDVNGNGVPDAKIEIYQRGADVDTKGKPQMDHAVTWFPLVEDGNFDKPVSKDPVIVGTTDANGIMRLPNRDVKEVKTTNGFYRKPNPFGNLNVVGQRGLLLVKVTKNNRQCCYFLEIGDFNSAWARGMKQKYTVILKTPYGSSDSPKPPVNVLWYWADKTNKKSVRIKWDQGQARVQHFLDKAIAYRIYRRYGNNGINDRPWFPVGTVNVNEREYIINLDQMMVNDVEWYSGTNRYGVSAISELGVESEIVQAAPAEPEAKQP